MNRGLAVDEQCRDQRVVLPDHLVGVEHVSKLSEKEDALGFKSGVGIRDSRTVRRFDNGMMQRRVRRFNASAVVRRFDAGAPQLSIGGMDARQRIGEGRRVCAPDDGRVRIPGGGRLAIEQANRLTLERGA